MPKSQRNTKYKKNRLELRNTTPILSYKKRLSVKKEENELYLNLYTTTVSVTQLKKGLVAQSCRTVCNPMDYSPPGSSVRGILQTRILQWAAILFSRRSS